MLSDILAIPPDDIHVRDKFVCLEARGQDNHVGRDEAFVGLDTVRGNSFGFFIRQKNLVTVQRFEIAWIKDSSLCPKSITSSHRSILSEIIWEGDLGIIPR